MMESCDAGIVTRPCPFCGWQPKASFKYMRSRPVRTEDGQRETGYSYRVSFICRRCHSRGRPVNTALMTLHPYLTSFYGRYKEHASDLVDKADAMYEPYIRKAAEYWNTREEK